MIKRHFTILLLDALALLIFSLGIVAPIKSKRFYVKITIKSLHSAKVRRLHYSNFFKGIFLAHPLRLHVEIFRVFAWTGAFLVPLPDHFAQSFFRAVIEIRCARYRVGHHVVAGGGSGYF